LTVQAIPPTIKFVVNNTSVQKVDSTTSRVKVPLGGKVTIDWSLYFVGPTCDRIGGDSSWSGSFAGSQSFIKGKKSTLAVLKETTYTIRCGSGASEVIQSVILTPQKTGFGEI
jgi:hypothetical protein